VYKKTYFMQMEMLE